MALGSESRTKCCSFQLPLFESGWFDRSGLVLTYTFLSRTLKTKPTEGKSVFSHWVLKRSFRKGIRKTVAK